MAGLSARALHVRAQDREREVTIAGGGYVTNLPCPDPDGIISRNSAVSVACINNSSCFVANRLRLSRRSAASPAVIAAFAGPAVRIAAIGAIAIPAFIVDADIAISIGRRGKLKPVTLVRRSTPCP